MTNEPFHPFDPPQFLQHARRPARRGRTVRAAPPVNADGDYVTTCPVCGQAYDLRELDEVLHHGAGMHDRLPTT
jgi:hypothetical protein